MLSDWRRNVRNLVGLFRFTCDSTPEKRLISVRRVVKCLNRSATTTSIERLTCLVSVLQNVFNFSLWVRFLPHQRKPSLVRCPIICWHFPFAEKRVKNLCVACGKTYRSSYQLKEHMRQHTGNFVSCTVCAKSFSMKTSLNAHMRTHQGEPKTISPLACSLSWEKHLLLQNGGATAKKYIFLSSRSFFFSVKREEYQCDRCDRRFLTKQACRQHQALHYNSGVKCSQCSKQFVNSTVLNNHIDSVHKGKKNRLSQSQRICTGLDTTECLIFSRRVRKPLTFSPIHISFVVHWEKCCQKFPCAIFSPCRCKKVPVCALWEETGHGMVVIETFKKSQNLLTTGNAVWGDHCGCSVWSASVCVGEQEHVPGDCLPQARLTETTKDSTCDWIFIGERLFLFVNTRIAYHDE